MEVPISSGENSSLQYHRLGRDAEERQQGVERCRILYGRRAAAHLVSLALRMRHVSVFRLSYTGRMLSGRILCYARLFGAMRVVQSVRRKYEVNFQANLGGDTMNMNKFVGCSGGIPIGEGPCRTLSNDDVVLKATNTLFRKLLEIDQS